MTCVIWSSFFRLSKNEPDFLLFRRFQGLANDAVQGHLNLKIMVNLTFAGFADGLDVRARTGRRVRPHFVAHSRVCDLWP